MIPRGRGGGEPNGSPLFSFMRLAPESADRIMLQVPGSLTSEFNRALVAYERDDERASRLAFPGRVQPTDRIAQTISLEDADVLLAAMRTTLQGLSEFNANTVAEVRDAASARAALLETAVAELAFCLVEADYYATHPSQG